MTFLPPLPVGVVLPYAGPLYQQEDGIYVPDSRTQFQLAIQSWLYCDGQEIYKEDYWELFEVIGHIYSPESLDKEGEKFALPDYRGLFLRGIGLGEEADPGWDYRTSAGAPDKVGSLQSSEFQGHQHTYELPPTAKVLIPEKGAPTDVHVPLGAPTKKQTTVYDEDKDDSDSQDHSSDDGTPLHGKETRPINRGVHFLICARQQMISTF